MPLEAGQDTKAPAFKKAAKHGNNIVFIVSNQYFLDALHAPPDINYSSHFSIIYLFSSD